MPRKPSELTALAVSKLSTPGLHFVGGVPGLALQVLPSGGRTWVLRMVIGSKRRDMGLGGYPGVTLALAREAARAARTKVREGVDPIEEAKAARSELKAMQAAAMTFEQCAAAYIAANRAGWKSAKHAQQWTNTLTQWAYPKLGRLLVRDVGLAQVLAVLEQPADPKKPDGPNLWLAKTETASRLRGRIETVLDWATVRSYRAGDNPARWRGHLDKLLPAPAKVAKADHHPAVPVGEVGRFMVQLRAATGVAARALEFTVLTAARSGEVRGARWPELDLAARVWIVPAERMKAGKEHRVPLSDAAVALLQAMPHLDASELVFPGSGRDADGNPRQLSDMALTAVMRRMSLEAVPHGFRSTFRDWAAERTNYPRDVAEMALAHTIGDKVEAAYRRGDLFEKRQLMMADWAKFISTVEHPAGVVDLGAARRGWHGEGAAAADVH